MAAIAAATLLALAASPRVAAAQLTLDVESGLLSATRNVVQRPGREDRAPGTRFDYAGDPARGDLDAERADYVRARLGLRYGGAGRNTVSVLAAPVTIRSTGAFARDVRFQNATFAARTPIAGTYQFSSYRATFRRDVLWRGPVRLGVGATVAIRDAFSRLEGATVGAGGQPGPRVRETYDNQGLIPPLLSLALDARVAGPVRLLADFDGGVSPDGKGRALDGSAALGVDLTRGPRPLTARVGYRVFEGGIDFDKAYNLVLLQQLGAGLTIRF
jgi:hypothetical protein